jgi:hypothetical protein
MVIAGTSFDPTVLIVSPGRLAGVFGRRCIWRCQSVVPALLRVYGIGVPLDDATRFQDYVMLPGQIRMAPAAVRGESDSTGKTGIASGAVTLIMCRGM